MLAIPEKQEKPLNNAKEMFVQTIFNTIAIQYIPLSCSCKPFAKCYMGYTERQKAGAMSSVIWSC